MRDVVLKLEAIRDDVIDKLYHHRRGRIRMGKQESAGAAGALGRRPFVKRIIGCTHAGKPVKQLVAGRKSYLEARGTGARGVYYLWNLPHGFCCQIQEAISRTKARRYYAIIFDGAVHEITERQAVLYACGKISLADKRP